MALQTTYVGIEPRTAIASSVAQVRGVRVTRDSTGVTAVTDIATRGDYVTLQAVAASAAGDVASMSGGGKVPALASEATTVGALAYSAAAGKFSVTSTSAVVVGRWTLAASGDNVLGEVELFSVA